MYIKATSSYFSSSSVRNSSPNFASPVGQFLTEFEGVSWFQFNLYWRLLSFTESGHAWTDWLNIQVLALQVKYVGDLQFGGIGMNAFEASLRPPLLQNTSSCTIREICAKKGFFNDLQMGKGFSVFSRGDHVTSLVHSRLFLGSKSEITFGETKSICGLAKVDSQQFGEMTILVFGSHHSWWVFLFLIVCL